MSNPTTTTAATTTTNSNMTHSTVNFLIVGGGIAGVTCAETIAICCSKADILLLTESNVIKTIANLEPIARYLHKFDVHERNLNADAATLGLAPCIVTIVDQLIHIDSVAKCVYTRGKRCIKYRYLCLCTGGTPRLIQSNNPRVLGIRDTDSVFELQRRLAHATQIVLVGNGGIASELAHELHGVELHWAVKDNHIASTFVDAGAAHFFQQKPAEKTEKATTSGVIKRLRYDEMLTESNEQLDKRCGAALGPDWHQHFKLSGGLAVVDKSTPIIHYETHVTEIAIKSEDHIIVTLSNGAQIKCDFLVSATGVDPRLDYTIDKPFVLAVDGGIAVNELMVTNLNDIYAAGDVCTANWPLAEHWFQMRLWTQARQMGAMAGRSMAASYEREQIYQDFCFELFGHVTKLFDYPVVLLGRYNGQGLGTDYELLLRSTPGKEYIKFVLQRGRLRGALLIGNTELAETCENLILNGTDLTPFGDDILNPDIDIEDYFD